MNEAADFGHHFWGKDPNDKEGYESLMKRYGVGYKTCRSLQKVIESHKKQEEEYNKKFASILNNEISSDEMPDCRNNLDAFKQLYDYILSSIGKRKEKLEEIYSRVSKFNQLMENQHQSLRRDYDDRSKALQRKYNQMHKDWQDAKQWRSKAEEYGKNFLQLEATTAKDAEKKRSKVEEKHREIVLQFRVANEKYLECVNSFNGMNTDFKEFYAEMARTYQELDQKRLEMIRNEMWLLSNVISEAAVANAEDAEKFRQRLEKSNPYNDAVAVIKEYGIDNKPLDIVVAEVIELPKLPSSNNPPSPDH